MEYGIWGLQAAGGLWGDPRLAQHHNPIVPPGTAGVLPTILPRIAFDSRLSSSYPLSRQDYTGAIMERVAKKLSADSSGEVDDNDEEDDVDDNDGDDHDHDDEPEQLDSSVNEKSEIDESADEYSTLVRAVVKRSMKDYENESESDGATSGEEEEEEEQEEEEKEVNRGEEKLQQTSSIVSICNNEVLEDENERSSTVSGSSRQTVNYDSSSKFMTADPLSCLIGFDKEENVRPILNNWVLGAYTAMLGRLSAAAAALEASQVPIPSFDSDFESDSSVSASSSSASSHTVKSGVDPKAGGGERREGGARSGATVGTHRSYSCDSCDEVATTRPALRKHMTEAHRCSRSSNSIARACPSSDCEFSSNSRCEIKKNGTSHAAVSGTRTTPTTSTTPTTGKKPNLALQRVRYRYEREEYRCSLCSYACTIEKAFERHLRAHARGNATETRVSCAVCGADRSSEVDLSRHMRRHRDGRYFCCDICVFRTVQLKKLIQHRRMHTGEKPHLCPHCAYRSARRDNLRSHVRRVHKEENLYCDTFSPRGMPMERSPSACEIVDADASATVSPMPSP